MEDKKRKNPTEKALEIIKMTPREHGHRFDSDVMGSYTGRPFDREKPVQDVDDI